jgi:hypothetical protein
MGTDKQTAETGYATLPVLLFFPGKTREVSKRHVEAFSRPCNGGAETRKKKSKNNAPEKICATKMLFADRKKKKKEQIGFNNLHLCVPLPLCQWDAERAKGPAQTVLSFLDESMSGLCNDTVSVPFFKSLAQSSEPEC